jgi:hypothetical protein
MPELRPPYAFIGENPKSTKPCKSYDLQGFELIGIACCRDGRIHPKRSNVLIIKCSNYTI